MNFSEHFDYIDSKDHKGDSFIQWKGTDVCIDLYCPDCGEHYHHDGDFMYYLQCPYCNNIYAVGHNIKLIKLNKEHIDFVKKDRPNFIKTPLKEEE